MNSKIKMHTSRRGPFWASVGIAVALVAATPATALAAPLPSTTSSANATSESTEISDQEVSAALQSEFAEVYKYIKPTASGEVYFDTEAARKGGASNDTIQTGARINQLAKSFSSSTGWNGRVNAPPAGVSTNWVYYGNWCGPNYGSGTPIDRLDTFCKVHDNCYKIRGRDACSCDIQLVNSIRGPARKYMGYWERAKADDAAIFFDARRRIGGCIKQDGIPQP